MCSCSMNASIEFLLVIHLNSYFSLSSSAQEFPFNSKAYTLGKGLNMSAFIIAILLLLKRKNCVYSIQYIVEIETWAFLNFFTHLLYQLISVYSTAT